MNLIPVSRMPEIQVCFHHPYGPKKAQWSRTLIFGQLPQSPKCSPYLSLHPLTPGAVYSPHSSHFISNESGNQQG